MQRRLELSEILPHLSERGRLEWELACLRAELAQVNAEQAAHAEEAASDEPQ